jgi:hypothetical protein
MNTLKVNHWLDAPKNYTGIVESINGSKLWYFNGKRHREDGPAAEYSDGGKAWHLNDKLHRVDGPAIEGINGYKAWYLNDINYSQEEWFERLSDEDKLKAIWNLK